MLMALSGACRTSELAALDMGLSQRLPNGIVFRLTTHAKTSKNHQRPGEAFFPTMPDDPERCPVRTLEIYVTQTSGWRCENVGGDRVFRSLIKPHKPITSTTLSHWLTNCLSEAGYNVRETGGLNGHSTRALATTKAHDSGRLTMDDILRAANWRTSYTFHKHYYKPDFGRTVLSSTQLKVCLTL